MTNQNTDHRVEEHLTAAGMAFDIILFLPIFLTNLVGVFSGSFFNESKLFFPAVLLIDIIILALFYSNLRKRKNLGEAILYISLLALLFISFVGVIAVQILKLVQ